jgi:kynurenine formamidase
MAMKKGGSIESKKPAWIDISYPLSENMLYWPQDPVPPDIKSISHATRGRRHYDVPDDHQHASQHAY